MRLVGHLHAPRRYADRDWLDQIAAAAAAAGLRADAVQHLQAVAEGIAGHADWRTLTARPTLARLIERTGLCRRTVQRWCRWLERAGWLAVLEPGTTSQYRPSVLYIAAAALAREWLLTSPEPDSAESVTPSPPPTAVTPIAGARDVPAADGGAQDDQERRSAACSLPGPPPGPRSASQWPLGQKTHRRAERLAAAETLRAGHMVLRRLSARALRHQLRPYLAAGWTPADVLRALDYKPDGTQHEHTAQVRVPAAWLAHRLGYWRQDGDLLPGHSAVLAARAVAHRAQLRADAARRAALTADRSANLAGAVLDLRQCVDDASKTGRALAAQVDGAPGCGRVLAAQARQREAARRQAERAAVSWQALQSAASPTEQAGHAARARELLGAAIRAIPRSPHAQAT